MMKLDLYESRLKKVHATTFSQFFILYSLGGKHPGFPVYSLILL